MSPPSHGDTTPAAALPSPKPKRRRPPNWPEQMKREAWGRFWAQVNREAAKR